MTQKMTRLALSAALLLALTGTALANKMEKVDIVKEGIDLAPIVVKANASGYGGYENPAHRYFVRLYAKAKGSNRVWWATVGNYGIAPFEVSGGHFFKQTAGHSEGWGVYTKSIAIDIAHNHAKWWGSPKEACDANLKTQMNKGKTKAQVLSKEWKLTAHTVIAFHAEADTKAHNKKDDHTISSSDGWEKTVSYPVSVVCRKGN